MAEQKRRIDTLQSIELAEGIEIHLRAAGPYLRFIAYFLDLIFQILTVVAIFFLLMFSLGFWGINVASGVFNLCYFFVAWLYPVIFECGKKGATPGKRIFGLRVVDEAGGTISVGQSMVRNFLRLAEMLVPFVPLVAFFHPRFQRLGDLAAGTLVVYARPRVDQVVSGPPAMETIPVNRTLTREEEAAILSFRYRSGSWSDVRRQELANHLQPLTGDLGPEGVNKVLGMANWLEGQR